jgi:hypothetical protein
MAYGVRRGEALASPDLEALKLKRVLPLVIVLAITVASGRSAGPVFYADDPIRVDPETQDASRTAPWKVSESYDLIENTFLGPGDARPIRALNVNTIDEVPDSSWFTNRIGRRPMSVEEVVRGPDRLQGVSLEGWVVSGGKGSGVQPGFRMTDPSGQLYQIEVDPPSNPELASAVEPIGTAFYHAMGYSVVEVYLAELDRRSLAISETATMRDPLNGKRRRLRQRDLDLVFDQAARLENGNYRVLVSRFAPGRPVGNFRYYGTRPDDPNDIVLHEHRRELRAARVFGAWLNHDDSRGINSLDMIETTDGRGWVKHYMFDFGSILGSGTVYAQRPRAGNEYIFEQRPGWLTLATLGLYIRPWMLIRYPDVPDSVGRIEAEAFDPLTWRPEYPNPAFDNMRPDDAFWGARIVAKFTDEMIRKVVEKARYSDPRATEYMTQVLIKRRDKVVAAYINQVCPVIDPALASDGTLRFANAAVDAKAATSPSQYTLQWFAFDNATNTPRDVGAPTATTATSGQAPPELLKGGDYVGVRISATHQEQPRWSSPATFIFRRTASAWEPVGAER